MENRFINASHDFTEQDRVHLNWLRRKEAREVRGELIRAGKETASVAIKDVALKMAVVAFVLLVVTVLVIIWSR